MYFDIGANCGLWTLKNNDPNRKIICVEASLQIFKSLENNVSKFKNIIPLNYAVCKSDNKFITFYNADTLSTLNKDWLTLDKSRFSGTSFYETTVETITIDKLIETYGMPELIKIDVEGAEHIVIKSLTQKVPLLCFEWASEWLEENIECVKYLNSLGFTKFNIQYEDKYDYKPKCFEHNIDTLINTLKNTIPKHDWGMIWCE